MNLDTLLQEKLTTKSVSYPSDTTGRLELYVVDTTKLTKILFALMQKTNMTEKEILDLL